MIVYGNGERLESAAAVSASIATMLLDVERAAAGIPRHSALVRAFIRASELVQGIADAQAERLGLDAPSALLESGSTFLLEMARSIELSWRGEFSGSPNTRRLVRQLEKMALSGWIRTRMAEGYAHYALYPESYLDAARRSSLGPDTCVIGIRSIGTGLAAIVSAALRAAPAFTLRPGGHPFEREIRADPRFLGIEPRDQERCFAIVDEGPGLSGSSFASVAAWLAQHGVDMARIHFFPSHSGGAGRMASSQVQQIWKECRIHPPRTDEVLLKAHGLHSWVAGHIGALEGDLEELPAALPAHHDSRFARRKFLARGQTGPWLIKFAGLGEIGERKFHDARALAAANYSPDAPALCHGFLVQKWIEGAPLSTTPMDRRRLIHVLAHYLAYRAQHLGSPITGASMDELHTVAIENTTEALGAAAGKQIEPQVSKLLSLGARVRRVRTDNRLHAWEWVMANGSLFKIDAVDHCEAHDLIGCQDIAWDVAGAMVEHHLTDRETDVLCRTMEGIGVRVDRLLLSAMVPCYLAFQLGMWSTAQGANVMPLAESYARKLSCCLGAS